MLVVGDVVHNEIVDLATHVWPCAGQLERSDVAGVMEYYKQEVVGRPGRVSPSRRAPWHRRGAA